MKRIPRWLFYGMLLGLLACSKPADKSVNLAEERVGDTIITSVPPVYNWIAVTHSIQVKNYFSFIDSCVRHWDALLPYPLTEYALVQANPWLIDSLAAADYYQQQERGVFIRDQKEWEILHVGDSLWIPDSNWVAIHQFQQALTWLDINIPAYTIRIIREDSVLYSFPARVGRNEKKFLAMAGRTVDLRTQTGVGTITRVDRNPTFINPSNNHRYTETRRDDGRVTQLPLIPWLEPTLNGTRYGQLIHPTTNQNTLGRAYSNGCIGVAEASAWYLYYYAPIGTRIVVRYDLEVVSSAGDSLLLRNIYPGFEKRPPVSLPPIPIAAADWQVHPHLHACGATCIGVWDGEFKGK